MKRIFGYIFNAIFILCVLYLIILGFAGKLSSVLGAIAWCMVILMFVCEKMTDKLNKEAEEIQKNIVNMYDSNYRKLLEQYNKLAEQVIIKDEEKENE